MIIDHLIAYFILLGFGLFVYSQFKKQTMKETLVDIRDMLKEKEVQE